LSTLPCVARTLLVPPCFVHTTCLDQISPVARTWLSLSLSLSLSICLSPSLSCSHTLDRWPLRAPRLPVVRPLSNQHQCYHAPGNSFSLLATVSHAVQSRRVGAGSVPLVVPATPQSQSQSLPDSRAALAFIQTVARNPTAGYATCCVFMMLRASGCAVTSASVRHGRTRTLHHRFEGSRKLKDKVLAIRKDLYEREKNAALATAIANGTAGQPKKRRCVSAVTRTA
jgi:hypothetical protein